MNNQQMCPICLSNDQTLYDLPCKHSFCKDCLDAQIRELVETKIQSKLCCATCNQEFDILKIQEIITQEVFNLYNSTLIKIGEVECCNEYEQFVQCDYEGCRGSFIINKAIQKIVCPLCQKELCHKCYKQQHFNQTCEQAQDMKDKDNQKFVQEAIKMGYAQCPQCKIMVEKVKGCNFMYCLNKKCHSYFCYQCGQLLNRSQHYSHYEKRDPYKGACIGQIQQQNMPLSNNQMGKNMLNQNKFQIVEVQNNFQYLQQMENIHGQNQNDYVRFQQLVQNNKLQEEIRKQQQIYEQLKIQEQNRKLRIKQQLEIQQKEQEKQEKLEKLEKLKKYTCTCGKVFNLDTHNNKYERCFQCNSKIFCHICIKLFDIPQLITHKCIE